MAKSNIHFPWLGFLTGGIFIIALIFFRPIENIELSGLGLKIPVEFEILGTTLLVIYLLLVARDVFQFFKSRRDFEISIQTYQEQIDELLRSKNVLNEKVHKYAGHADKLKLFISDRLLEYIEYDEKFFHFKNIASEIRHNGVISYDKVISALKTALQQEVDRTKRIAYESALDSMIYLWDLLDLSTTDNIAMYIANKLYVCEEHYYRSTLQSEDANLPISTHFVARQAVIKAICNMLEDPDMHDLREEMENSLVSFENQNYLIELNKAGNLLGNENYIVLMVENLIQNGLYYTNRKQKSKSRAKIHVQLYEESGKAKLSIYNPGPNIENENKDKIFQLGFTTKRTKGNQGRGLGLYFVKQIVNGYEGNIEYRNIVNEEDTYVVRIELSDRTVINEILESEQQANGRLLCKVDGVAQKHSHRFKFNKPIVSVEVAVQSKKKTYKYEIQDDEDSSFYDPDQPARPSWSIDLNKRRNGGEMLFSVLDTTGVIFTVTLPTAESRLDPTYHELEKNQLEHLENLDLDVKDIDEYL